MDAMGYTYQESIGKTSRLFVLLIATHHPYAYVYTIVYIYTWNTGSIYLGSKSNQHRAEKIRV